MLVMGCKAAGSDSAPSGSISRLVEGNGIAAVVMVGSTPVTPFSGSKTSGCLCAKSTCGSKRWYCVR